jgi:hypothetical protein
MGRSSSTLAERVYLGFRVFVALGNGSLPETSTESGMGLEPACCLVLRDRAGAARVGLPLSGP